MNRCGSFPLLSAPPLSLAYEQTLKVMKRFRGTDLEVRRVDLAKWVLRTSSKFTSGVKYQFHQGFWPDQKSQSSFAPLSTLMIDINLYDFFQRFHLSKYIIWIVSRNWPLESWQPCPLVTILSKIHPVSSITRLIRGPTQWNKYREFPGIKTAERRTRYPPLPSVVAVFMTTVASSSPMGRDPQISWVRCS